MSRAPSRAKAGAPRPVIEYLARARTTWGTRIYADGDSEEWIEGAGWQPLVHVDDHALTALLGMVRESGFYALPASIEPTIPVRDGTTATWTIELDGRRHTVTARRLNFEPNPILQRLSDEVQRVIGEALNKEADAAGADDTGRPAG